MDRVYADKAASEVLDELAHVGKVNIVPDARVTGRTNAILRNRDTPDSLLASQLFNRRREQRGAHDHDRLGPVTHLTDEVMKSGGKRRQGNMGFGITAQRALRIGRGKFFGHPFVKFDVPSGTKAEIALIAISGTGDQLAGEPAILLADHEGFHRFADHGVVVELKTVCAQQSELRFGGCKNLMPVEIKIVGVNTEMPGQSV